ncbi:TPA: hypothetical protein HA351_07255 [Methanosarcinaceae archaeon]|nr:hypothetical protein [Methanosarcinaceae archaeon]
MKSGPAEDVVEKWPRLQVAEHELAHKSYQVRKSPGKKMLLKKGLKNLDKSYGRDAQEV